jgi:hypothetical protein
MNNADERLLDALANKEYRDYLKSIIYIIGSDDVTYNTKLNTIGRYLFGSLFMGVFARDKKPSNTSNRYCIVNLDTTGMPGSHWVAIADNIVYDSFGRNLGFKGYDMPDPDAEQLVRQNDCGQRSLAWLCVYHTLGRRAAMKI